jgi:hypothetical protein
MCVIITEVKEFFFSADDEGASAKQSDGKIIR